MALEELQNGRYRRLRTLGSGGMGEVHLVEDTRINRQVARAFPNCQKVR